MSPKLAVTGEVTGGVNKSRFFRGQDGEFEMARFDMSAADMGSMAEMQPNAEGLFDLGIVYAVGAAGRPDLVAAHKWFNLSALRGNDEAAYHRQQIAEELTAAQIAEAQRAAREWLSTH